MENVQPILAQIEGAVPRLPELAFEAPVDWILRKGEQWAVIGPNGAGKTLLADLLQRKFSLKQGEVRLAGNASVADFVKSIAFKDIYSMADCRNTYYQQRFQATENDDVPRVSELLPHGGADAREEELMALFGISELLPKKLVYLSSGELR